MPKEHLKVVKVMVRDSGELRKIENELLHLPAN